MTLLSRSAHAPALWAKLARGLHLAPLLSLAIGFAFTPTARAEQTVAASTSDDARQEAIAAIPLAKVDPQYRAAVRSVLDNPSLFRRLPTNVVDCRPEMFTYFAENPDVLVEIWRELGMTQVELVRTGPGTYRLADGAGTTGRLVVVESSCDENAQNRVVLFTEGAYEGKPFTKPVSAQCVLVLRSGSVLETNGRHYVASRLDSFVKLDRPSMEILAKAAHPFVGHTADKNFADTLAFVSNFSYTAERRPETIERLTSRLEAIEAPRRTKLVGLAARCAALSGEVVEVSHAEDPASALAPR